MKIDSHRACMAWTLLLALLALFGSAAVLGQPRADDPTRCERRADAQLIGGAVGGLVGGALGAEIGADLNGGDGRRVGAAAGALLGALIGSRIGREIERDREDACLLRTVQPARR